MHTTYYFLRQLAAALTTELRGARVTSCFSQEKDELVVGLVTARGAEFWLRAQLGAAFPALALPESFHRARQNSVDLLPELLGRTVAAVAAWPYDRVLQVTFEDGATLAFKLYGPRPNAIFRPAPDAPAQLFHQRYVADADLHPAAPTPQAVAAARAAVAGKGAALTDADVAQLEQPAAFHITYREGRTRLSLLPQGEVQETLPGADPIGALRRFVPLALMRRALEAERQQLRQVLTRRADEADAGARYARQRLHALAHEAGYRHRADLIMAHLHAIEPGATQVEVEDFLTGQLVTLKLKALEKPQQTAAALYRKAKNQQREETELRARIERRDTEAFTALERLEELDARPELTELRPLRAWRKQHGLEPAALVAQPASTLPFKVFEDRGFTILVGRSAQNNDLLTQRYAHKDDLWLHAKDVSGSHVVVRHQAGKTVPEPVVEHAAQLAAWYSKRQHDSLCPVTVTPKKFVRKRKGALPGQVVVERERVVLVVPGNPFGERE